jgi:hypothetical protein
MDPTERWDQSHATILRNFLDSDTGKLTVSLLHLLRPPFALTQDTNEIVRQHGRQEGYERYASNLDLITRSEFLQPPESDVTQYVPLDDDSKWKE